MVCKGLEKLRLAKEKRTSQSTSKLFITYITQLLPQLCDEVGLSICFPPLCLSQSLLFVCLSVARSLSLYLVLPLTVSAVYACVRQQENSMDLQEE